MDRDEVIRELQATFDYAKEQRDRIMSHTDGPTMFEGELVRLESAHQAQGMMNAVGITARGLMLLDGLNLTGQGDENANALTFNKRQWAKERSE